MSSPPPLLSEAGRSSAPANAAATAPAPASGSSAPTAAATGSSAPIAAAAAAAPNASNGSPWQQITSPSGQVYWANRVTGATQWTRPAELPAEENLTNDWAKVLDPASGKYYYANRKTFATSWSVPPEIAAASSKSSPSASAAASGTSTPVTRNSQIMTASLTAAPAPFSEAPIPPPADYERIMDPSTNRFYYVHLPTRSVSWNPPEAFKAFEEQERRMMNHKILSQSQQQNQPPPLPVQSQPAAAAAIPFAPLPPEETEAAPSPSQSADSATPARSSIKLPGIFSSPAPPILNSPDAASPPRRMMPPPVPSIVTSMPTTPSSQASTSSTQSPMSVNSGSFSHPHHAASRSIDLNVQDPNRFRAMSATVQGEKDKEEIARPSSSSVALGGGSIPRDKRGLPILPPGLKSEITKFALSGYASEHFRVFKKKSGLMSTRKVTVAEILCWQKACIHKSLLASAKNVSSFAVQSFGLIQNFMGDVPSKKAQAAIAKEIIQLAVNKPELRNEVYSQLAKQTKNNPDMKSTVNGWRLTALCASAFAPTRDFQDYLLKYFVDNFTFLDEVPIWANYCYWRLLKTLKDGPTENTFSLQHLEQFGKTGIPSWAVHFDLSLEYMVQLQKAEGSDAPYPLILSRLCEAVKALGGFQMKGIFRIAAQKENIQALRSSLERGDYAALKNFDAHTVADILKIWLRDAYETIFPSEMYEKCLAAADNQSAAWALCQELTPAHFATLDYLMRFLVELNAQQEVTAMNEENLAIVFSQDIMREPSGALSGDALSMALVKSNKEKNFVKTLIEVWKKK